jgi:hypothetical protein
MAEREREVADGTSTHRDEAVPTAAQDDEAEDPATSPRRGGAEDAGERRRRRRSGPHGRPGGIIGGQVG